MNKEELKELRYMDCLGCIDCSVILTPGDDDDWGYVDTNLIKCPECGGELKWVGEVSSSYPLNDL